MEQAKLEIVGQDDGVKGKTTREKVKNTLTEELFLGICAPIGSMKDEVISSIKKVLNEKYNYEVQILKLADYIEKYKVQDYKQKDGKTEGYSK